MIKKYPRDSKENPHKMLYDRLKSIIDSFPSDTPESKIEVFKNTLESIDKIYQDSLEEETTTNK